MSRDDRAITHPITVAWGEQDAFGHVNNVAYFRYLESARMHLLDRLGFMDLYRNSGVSVILASTNCHFRQAVNWPAELQVHMTVSRVGNTSFDIAYRIVGVDGTLHAEAGSTQVVFDYRSGTKLSVPESVRSAIFALFDTNAP